MVMSITTKITTVLMSFGLLLGITLYAPVSVSAQACFDGSGNIEDCLNAGACVDTTGQNSDCPQPNDAEDSVNSTIELVINVLSFVVGIVAVIMIIIGGLKYITSSGDANSISSAKNTILYAIIGLVIVALAQIIVRFVLNTATTPPAEEQTGVVELIQT